MSFQQMGMNALSGINGTNGTQNMPKDYTELFETTGKEISNTICNNIYSSNKNKVNLKDSINIAIINLITDTLSKETYKKKIFDTIFGETEKNGKNEENGLRKYIHNLFKLSAGNNKELIYPFTGRVLQHLFRNDIINEMYNKIQHNVNDEINDTIESFKKVIMKELTKTEDMKKKEKEAAEKAKGKKAQAAVATETAVATPAVAVATPIVVNERLSPYEKLEKNNDCPTQQANNVLTEMSNNIKDMIVNKINRDSSIIETIKSSIDGALKDLIESNKYNIYKEITQGVVNKFTSLFIDDKSITLQIVHTILSYDGEEEYEYEGEGCEKTKIKDMEDNTLYIAKNIFIEAIQMKKTSDIEDENKKQAKRKLTDILRELIENSMQERDGGITDSINSITNMKLQGGQRGKSKKRGRKIKSRFQKKRKTRRRKSIRK